MSGRPGSSSRWIWPRLFGRPISGKLGLMLRPPRSNTRKMSPGGITCQAGSGARKGNVPRAFSAGDRAPGPPAPGEKTSAGWLAA